MPRTVSKNKYFIIVLFFAIPCVFLPFISHAAIVINEVAWMGTVHSANDEWIELYNNGSSEVSVDGWTLTDGVNLSIELAGTVGAGAYAVLERTDDSSAPSKAFLIYTGALTNTGATLKLIRDDGGIEDQVAGGDNWENIGGDNTTKETAQYTNAGWVTGSPTAGVKNVTSGSHDPDDDNQGDEDKDEKIVSANKKSTEKVAIKAEDWELELTLTAPDIAYVNQFVEFEMEPNGLPDILLNSVRYNWNLGDLTAVSGKDVTHRYQYAGTYVVFVEGFFKEHRATIRHEITVLPVSFSMTKNADGDVQIHNDAKYEVDLSEYSVRGDRSVVFPKNTILLPNATITIPKEKIGGSGYAWLFDQKANIVASLDTLHHTQVLPVQYSQERPVEQSVVATMVSKTVAAQTPEAFVPPPATKNQNFVFSDDVPETLHVATTVFVATTNVEEEEEEELQTATVNQANVPIDASKLPYLGLIGVLSLGILALYATRVK